MKATVTVELQDRDGHVTYEVDGPIFPLVDIHGAVNQGLTEWIESAREGHYDLSATRTIREDDGEVTTEEL